MAVLKLRCEPAVALGRGARWRRRPTQAGSRPARTAAPGQPDPLSRGPLVRLTSGGRCAATWPRLASPPARPVIHNSYQAGKVSALLARNPPKHFTGFQVCDQSQHMRLSLRLHITPHFTLCDILCDLSCSCCMPNWHIDNSDRQKTANRLARQTEYLIYRMTHFVY